MPVLCDAVQKSLSFGLEAVVVDGTVGHGGHAAQLAERLGKDGLFVGLDVDAEALGITAGKLKDVKCRVELRRERFSNLAEI